MPNTVVIDANEPAYRRVFRQVLTSLQEISDRVEHAALGVALVSVVSVSVTSSHAASGPVRYCTSY